MVGNDQSQLCNTQPCIHALHPIKKKRISSFMCHQWYHRTLDSQCLCCKVSRSSGRPILSCIFGNLCSLLWGVSIALFSCWVGILTSSFLTLSWSAESYVWKPEVITSIFLFFLQTKTVWSSKSYLIRYDQLAKCRDPSTRYDICHIKKGNNRFISAKSIWDTLLNTATKRNAIHVNNETWIKGVNGLIK